MPSSSMNGSSRPSSSRSSRNSGSANRAASDEVEVVFDGRTAASNSHTNTNINSSSPSTPSTTGTASPMEQPRKKKTTFKDVPVSRKSSNGSNSSPNKPASYYDDIFDPFQYDVNDDDGIKDFLEEDSEEEYDDELDYRHQVYNDPKAAILNDGVHQIPGSPWAKPANRPSNRPTEPLSIAKYASTVSFVLTIGFIGFLFYRAISEYSFYGRIIVEIIIAILSFFGLFWNSYFTVSSIFKCFIPTQAFKTNTKYCSMIPEDKSPHDEWLDVTIQIPVYKESLQEVLMPTLKSCMKSRDHYMKNTGAECNIVVCDDGMMAFLKDNFAAAEMLWETIIATKGKVLRLSKLLQQVPRPSRRHLKGLRSHSIYEVFHRMIFYYHYQIGFVARSTINRRGKFKKASNCNSHLRLVWGAEQVVDSEAGMSFDEALIQTSHNANGSRYVMFGNNISIGHLILINDADARMSETVIMKTVPEFLNDPSLGFTQHATKTMDDQRGESYYINMLSVYTDALYQGHFLLSSILGCHPPLVGHSIILRSEAVKQCGRMRTLRATQRWLKNIGLPFLSVDQVGSGNLHDNSATEYWSENHVSEDFELMIHLYNLGFNGRYIAYPECEFQEGITRTFDEEAGRHRKFALGAHELMFNPINSWVGQGIFSPLFRTFLSCDIPSYYKIFLTAYLFSYTSGGCYLLVFTSAAVARLLDRQEEIGFLNAFNSAGVLILSIVVYYIIGYFSFLVAMVRMRLANKHLLFPEYRDRSIFYLIYMKIRYALFFQLMFYSVMGNYFFLGSMDHLLARPGIVSATNKDSISISRCSALWEVMKFNSGSWMISLYLLALGYAVVVEEEDWDPTSIPENWIDQLVFAGPAAFMAILAFIVPIILNPFVLGWPFHPSLCCSPKKKEVVKSPPPPVTRKTVDSNGRVVDLKTFMSSDPSKELDKEIDRIHGRPDVELGSLATNDFGGRSSTFSVAGPSPRDRQRKRPTAAEIATRQQRQEEKKDESPGPSQYGHVVRKTTHDNSGSIRGLRDTTTRSNRPRDKGPMGLAMI